MSNLRRLYLRVTLKLLILTGLGLAAIPFIASLQRAGDSPNQNDNPWMVEVDLSRVATGEILTVPWPGGEIWVHHRSHQDIEFLQSLPRADLQDPTSERSEQPHGINPVLRSFRPEYFVFIPRETRRGCQVQQIELQPGITGYSEACFGASFDSAGRIFKGSGQAEQHNLSIPQHEFTGPTSLRLLPPQK